jgi:uncharacterized membrane protein YhfC
MTMDPYGLVAQLLLTFGTPLLVALHLVRWLGGGWRIIGIGALFFLLSQALNTPLRLGAGFLLLQLGLLTPFWGVLSLALIAGFGEELARYLAMRFVSPLRGQVSVGRALLYGTGHGGVESFLVGANVLAAVVLVALLQGDPALRARLPPVLVEQLEAARGAPWYAYLAAGVERVSALAMHLGLSVLVAQVFLRGALRFLPLAMVLHAMANLAVVSLLRATDTLVAAEALAVLFALAFLVYVVREARASVDAAAPPISHQRPR